MLEIQNLTKKYGEKTAVNNLSLHIGEGEICAFIGHNGAGKTTTIKACTGIIPFDEGEIFIDGKSIKAQPLDCKKKFAYIPDNPDLYEFYTGYKYLNFIADVYNIPSKERIKRIEYYSEMFEIKKDLNKIISSYSHGMKQKIAIIAAFLHSPELLIMDEPFVGLDPTSSYRLKELMKKLVSDGGAIFFSTHVLEVAQKLCDKVAIIRNGNLLKYGTMDDIIGDKELEQVFLETETTEKSGE